MSTIIKAIKHIQDTAIFTRNGESCSAAVVKLTGRQTYLLTAEENKNQFQFDSFPASELFKYYQELLLAEKQIECYKLILDNVQEVLYIMNGRVQKPMDTEFSERSFAYALFSDPLDLGRKEKEEEKEYAESKLTSLERKLTKIRLKIGAQSELESLLVSVAGCVLGEIYEKHDTDNKKRSLFENVNNILGLMDMNKNLKCQDFSRNIEALNLAAENELSKLGNTTENPQVSGSLAASQTMQVRLPSSQPRQQSDSVGLLNTDLHEAGCSIMRSPSLSALADEHILKVTRQSEIWDTKMMRNH